MSAVVIAQEATASSAGSLIFFVAIIAAFYFFVIRPQRNRAKKQQQVVESLSIGDVVQTVGGLLGIVKRIDTDEVVLTIESGEIRVVKRAIANQITDDPKES